MCVRGPEILKGVGSCESGQWVIDPLRNQDLIFVLSGTFDPVLCSDPKIVDVGDTPRAQLIKIVACCRHMMSTG